MCPSDSTNSQGYRSPKGCSEKEGAANCAPPAPSLVPWLPAAQVRAHLVEIDGDHTGGVGAQVGRLVHDEVQAVATGQVEGVGEVLDIVLLVERLSEPGREVAAGRNAAWIIGREGDRSFIGTRHPELVAHREEGDVEDLVRRYRGERSRLARTRVRHRVREQCDVMGVLGDRDRPLTARVCQRGSRRQQRDNGGHARSLDYTSKHSLSPFPPKASSAMRGRNSSHSPRRLPPPRKTGSILKRDLRGASSGSARASAT